MSRANPVWGIDVSSHQGYVSWVGVAAEGFEFMICKATEGTYYADDYTAHNLHWAERRGLVAGVYHFLTNEDTDAQLDLFLSHIGGAQSCEGKLIAVDVEATGWGGNPSTTDTWNFIHGLRARIGDHPILIYSGHWYWSGHLGDPDLTSLVDGYGVSIWVSRYVSGTGYASVLYQDVPDRWWEGRDAGGFGGQKPSILQFSDRAAIAGQKMDANAFAGSEDDLRSLTVSRDEKGVGMDEIIQRAVDHLLPANGALYSAWSPGVGDTGPPMWSDRLPSAKEIHDGGAICTTVTNCFMHVAEVEIPAFPGYVTGGTGAMERVYDTGEYPFERGSVYPRGTLFGAPFKGNALVDQGHVAVSVSREPEANPWVMQEDTGLGWNTARRLYATDDFSSFSYAVPPEVWLAD